MQRRTRTCYATTTGIRMKNKLSAWLAFLYCVVTASIVSAYPDDAAFIANKPQVFVTPDALPLLSWNASGADRKIDPSELNQLDLCTPDACPQEALDAGAAYYQITDTLIAYYDEHGRLVGTSTQATPSFADFSDSFAVQAIAEPDPDDPRFTDAGVPVKTGLLVGATPGAFQVCLPARLRIAYRSTSRPALRARSRSSRFLTTVRAAMACSE